LSKEHLEAWGGKSEADPLGFSKFQMECLDAFKLHVQGDGIKIAELEDGKHERYYTGILIDTNLTFYIYIDGAELSGQTCNVRLEEWDFKTPEDLIKEFIKRCLKEKSGKE